MVPRKELGGVLVLCVVPMFAGCDAMSRPWQRKDDSGVVHATAEEDEDDPQDRETKGMVKKFFKGNRLPGGLSSEAQEIESRLGVD